MLRLYHLARAQATAQKKATGRGRNNLPWGTWGVWPVFLALPLGRSASAAVGDLSGSLACVPVLSRAAGVGFRPISSGRGTVGGCAISCMHSNHHGE